jgi:hypothetical protein
MPYKHTAMRGLQAVAHIRQRSSNDYAHGVIHLYDRFHFIFE